MQLKKKIPVFKSYYGKTNVRDLYSYKGPSITKILYFGHEKYNYRKRKILYFKISRALLMCMRNYGPGAFPWYASSMSKCCFAFGCPLTHSSNRKFVTCFIVFASQRKKLKRVLVRPSSLFIHSGVHCISSSLRSRPICFLRAPEDWNRFLYSRTQDPLCP